MKVFIYVLKHPVTNEIRYVGLTRVPAKRLRDEISCPHTRHFANWVNSIIKIGLKPLMEIVEETEEGLACDREREWIAKMKLSGYRLLNFTSGGESGWIVSDELRLASSRRQKGKKKGPMPDQVKAKISAALKGRQLGPGAGKQLAALNVQRKGIPLKEETKRKLSVIGKSHLKGEWFDRFMEGNRNRKRASKFTDEQKAEIKFLIAEGYSQRLIADAYGTDKRVISEVKRGKYWTRIAPAKSASRFPEFKIAPRLRNERGQYERAA
jgi:hypothetical protein